MDGQGNIDVNAPKNFTINAGEDVNITAGKNVSVSSGENMVNSASKDISQTAGHDLNQTAAGDFTESANNKTEIIEEKHIRSSLESTQHEEKVGFFSTKEIMLVQYFFNTLVHQLGGRTSNKMVQKQQNKYENVPQTQYCFVWHTRRLPRNSQFVCATFDTKRA